MADSNNINKIIMGNNDYLNLLTNYAKALGTFAYVIKHYHDGSGLSKNEVITIANTDIQNLYIGVNTYATIGTILI